MPDQIAPQYGGMPLLASNARNAARDSGPCAICARLLARGQRVATLASGCDAHLPCIGGAQ